MFKKRKDTSKLDKLIDACIHELHSNHLENSKEYAQILDQLVKLNEMKTKARPSRVSPDTMALIGANLLGILMILKHERVDIITSKAMTHVIKPR